METGLKDFYSKKRNKYWDWQTEKGEEWNNKMIPTYRRPTYHDK
jgi:hypothetical protein